MISVIAILTTLLVTIAYGKTTLVTKSEFELLRYSIESLDHKVEMILEHLM